MIRKQDLDSFKSMVEKSLMQKCNISHLRALEMMNDSTFNDLLQDDPMFVAHYSPDYWVDDILEEHEVLHS